MSLAGSPGEVAPPNDGLRMSSRLLADHELVRRVPLFSSLTPQQARRLAASATKRECRRGALILSPEEMPDALYVVLSGDVRLVLGRLRGGRQIVLATLGSGDVFGEGVLFDRPAQRIGAYASSAVHLMRLDVAAVRTALLDSVSVGYSLAAHLYLRLTRAHQRIFDLAGSSAQARLLEALRDLAQPEGTDLVLRHKLSARELGMTIGVTREYVSRLLKELEASGAIRRGPDGSLRLPGVPGAAEVFGRPVADAADTRSVPGL